MCGITGFVGSGSIETLRRMTAALAHRGPDGSGEYHDREQPVFLGHRRLSIIDLTGGAQPMWTRDGTLAIVFNGQIYNHLELRRQLEATGHAFVTDHSDTEVLLYAYREWGAKLVHRLNGMWAFAIYDRPRGRLFCSRDRFGEKPFFYAHAPGIFAFGSELTALEQHPRVPRDLSHKALLKYFAYGYIPAPHSIYRAVQKLPGGHSLHFDLATERLEIEQYWDFLIEPPERIPDRAGEVWAEELRFLLDQAVKRRLMSDVPLGTFLSGGIDSSAVTAFAAAHVPRGALRTFSIGFETPTFDESRYAALVANAFGTDHHMEMLTLDHARDLLPEIGARLDEPIGDASLLPTYLLSRHARRYVTVALGGDGADELFAGYDTFRALRLAELYNTIVPKPVHHAIRLLLARLPARHGYMTLDFRLKRTLRAFDAPARIWCPLWQAPLERHELEELFHESVSLDEVYEEAIAEWDSCTQGTLVDRCLRFYTKLYMQDDVLAKVDRASMMNSLEVRSPFLDIDLVDFVRKLPAAYKLRRGRPKYLLAKALAPVLPADILRRPKRGFQAPTGQWFKQGALSLAGSPLRGLDPGFATNRQIEHAAGQSDHRAFLWSYWLLHAWTSTRSR